MKKSLIVIVLFLICALEVSGQGASADAVAELFVPADIPTLPGLSADLHWFAIDADLDAAGNRGYVVALYSNGTFARLRVIRRTLQGPQLVADPRFPVMHERSPRLTLLDVDADGRPEIIASLSTGRGRRSVWVFRGL